MIYTFYISTASSLTYQVYPLNWLDTTLVDEKERGQQFYRRKLEGDLTFGGKKLCADFDLLYGLWQTDPYQTVYILILRDGDSYFDGYFSPANGDFDLRSRTFTVKPKVLDDYYAWELDGDKEYNLMDITTLVTVQANGISYNRCRWLMDCIEYLAEQIFPGVTISSTFFTSAIDPITLGPSKLLYLTIAQKSDIKRNGSSDPATIANISFNEFFEILRNMFNVYWTYDQATNILTLEHLSHFSNTSGLDLRTQEISKSMLSFKYETEAMPRHEKWSFMEAYSPDFKGGDIYYDSPAVDSGKTDEVNMKVTTEIEYIQNNIDSVSDEGFVILSNYLSGGSYYTYTGPGQFDTTIRTNITLGWGYLLMSYFRHGRVLPQGYIHLILRDFISVRKNIIQTINAIVCSLNYHPEDYITTELGETYFSGLKGYVKKAVIKPYGEINFTLMYGPQDSLNEGWSPTSKSLSVTVDELTGEVRSEFSEANIYDTYYSIWSNDDVCDQIRITAGTMIQNDVLTQVNPIVSLKFNFSDSSLTGWAILVNGSTTYLTATEGECSAGAGAPPPVPDVPDIVGHGQTDTCGPIRVNWTAEAGATYYVLQRTPDLGGNTVYMTIYSGSALFYEDYNAGLQEGVTFNYKVASGNISGLSGWSAEHEVNDVMC